MRGAERYYAGFAVTGQQTADYRQQTMRDYKKIKAWQLSSDLAVKIYEITKLYPKDELYGLTSQMRRAAASISANIAEGSARASKKEYLQFLYVAKGSARELESFIILSGRIGLLSDSDLESSSKLCTECIHTLFGLIQAVSSEV